MLNRCCRLQGFSSQECPKDFTNLHEPAPRCDSFWTWMGEVVRVGTHIFGIWNSESISKLGSPLVRPSDPNLRESSKCCEVKHPELRSATATSRQLFFILQNPPDFSSLFLKDPLWGVHFGYPKWDSVIPGNQAWLAGKSPIYRWVSSANLHWEMESPSPNLPCLILSFCSC